jgi:Fe-S-cluster-containing dehydrogenase component
MCFERQAEGKKPACVEACPTDALMFGIQVDNLKSPGTASTRIRPHVHSDLR